ncbi:MAG: hypothetical protein F7C37_07565 [Desulfurococcales archaeon]|nr:hypothetical protein [Desulfurococcales archaeon]
MTKVRRFILNLASGILLGLVYYIVYLSILPRLLTPNMGLFQNVNITPLQSIDYQVSIVLLITIGVMERVIEHPVVAVLRVLSKLVGALLLYIITNGGIITATVDTGSTTLTVTADLSLIIYSIIMASAIIGIIDAGSAIVKYSAQQ